MDKELVQHVIHDLKNPLTILIGGLHLLKEGNMGDLSDQQREYIKSLELSGQDMLQMVDDYLDVERLENGVISFYRVPTNIELLLQKVVDYWSPHALGYGIELTFEACGEIPSISVDKRLMRRLLANLLKNALRYTSENGRVLVKVQDDEFGVTVQVADSGTIMPLDQREIAFSKYARLDGGTNRDIGLGLPFCKLVAELHGGELLIEESEFGGTAFILYLPYQIASSGYKQATKSRIIA